MSETMLLSEVLGISASSDDLEAEVVVLAPINYSQSTPKKTRIPIPEAAKGFALPKDINAFIELLYPNMRAFVDAKFPRSAYASEYERQSLVEEVLNTFVVYELSPAPTRNNTLRWKLYDPVKYAKQPYYKWFLIQLDYHRKTRQRDFAIDRNRMMSLSETTYDDTAGDPGNNAIHIDRVSEDLSADTFSQLEQRELIQYLQNFSARFINRPSPCFEKNAYALFQYRLADYSNSEIGDKLGISVSAVPQWMKRLRMLVDAFFEAGPEEANYVMNAPVSLEETAVNILRDYRASAN